MEEPPTGFANLYCVDVGRAAVAPHADYMFPLMRAVNDTYFYGRWGTILLEYKEVVPTELVNFVHKTRQAQTFEILNGFVCGILPKSAGTPRPIYAYLQKNSNIADLFEVCKQYALNEKMMEAFKGVRNKLIFHYDCLDSHTRRVLPEMAKYWDRDTDLHSSAMVRDAHILTRYLCGDLFEDIGWHMLHETFDPNSYFASRPGRPPQDGIYTPEYIEFFSSASADFCEFGRAALLQWFTDFDLVLSRSTDPINVEETVKEM